MGVPESEPKHAKMPFFAAIRCRPSISRARRGEAFACFYSWGVARKKREMRGQCSVSSARQEIFQKFWGTPFEKIPLRPKFWNPKKIPPKYREKIPKLGIFGIFGVFFRYFRGILGVNSGSPEFTPRGYFFGISRGNSGSGHLGAL